MRAQSLTLASKPAPEHKVEQAERARQARIDAGQARPLLDPFWRDHLFFWLMHHFHSSTRSLLMYAGLSSDDFSRLSRSGYINYKKLSWRPTSRSKDREISCVTLSDKGKRYKNRLLNVMSDDNQSKPIPDRHLGHELVLQAYIFSLINRDQLIRLLGPALIRDGATRRYHDYFDLTGTRWSRVWQFDALVVLGGAEGSRSAMAIEVERTKKDLRDQQKFFDKLQENSLEQCRVLILTETEAAKEAWLDRLDAWRTLGRPEKNRTYDKNQLLADQGRTVVESVDAIGFESIITGLRRPSGRGTKRLPKSLSVADFRVIETLMLQADDQQHRARVAQRLEETFEALEEPPSRGDRPVSVSDWEALPDHTLLLTIDEARALADPAKVIDHGKLNAVVRRRTELIMAGKRARMVDDSKSPAPPKKQGLLSKFRK